MSARLNAMSRARCLSLLTRLNPYHGLFARVSLVWVGLSDGYGRLVASGTVHDPRLF